MRNTKANKRHNNVKGYEDNGKRGGMYNLSTNERSNSITLDAGGL